MPPFQYERYSNPYVQSISALLEQPGQIEAQRAQTIGNAQANAALQSGQAWGGAIQGAGQAVSGAIQQATDPRRQMEQMQVDLAKKSQAYQAATNGIVSNLMKQNPDGTRTIDRAKLAQQLAASNVPLAMQKEVFTSLDDVDKSVQSFNTLRTDHRADFAHAALSSELGKTPEGVIALAGIAKANGIVSDEDLQPIFQALAKGSNPKAILEGIRGFSEKYKDVNKPIVLPPTPEGAAPAKLITPAGEQIATGGQSQAKPIILSEGATAIDPITHAVIASGGPKALDEFQTFKASYPKTLGKTDWATLTPQQQVTGLGAYAESKADPAMRAAALAQKNLTELLAQAQLNTMPTPEQAKSVADDLVNHRLAPEQLASLFSTRGKEGLAFKLAVTAEAKKMNPTFNFEEASAEYNLAKSPGFQNTVRYMDAAVESIPRLEQTAKKLGNGQFKSVNDLVNASKNQFNDTDLKAFKVDALLVGDEIAKILQGGGTGSGVSDAKLKQASDLISTSDSVPAIAAAVKEVQFLIGNRRQSLTRGTYMERASTPAATPAAQDFSIKRTPVR